MSGIVGLWNVDGRPVERRELLRLAASQRHRNRDGEGVWIQNEIGLLVQNLWVTPESVGEIQPLVTRSGVVVLFDGRLDNREDLLTSLEGCGVSRESSDAALVAATYRKVGSAFPEMLLGDFALVIYDIATRRLLLARDGIGVRSLYFSQAGKCVIVATECKTILAHPQVRARPNPDAIAGYFLACMGQDREGWTFFDGIYGVVPGQLVVITRNSIVRRTFWDFSPAEPPKLKSFPEYAESLRYHLDRAVARRTRSYFPVTVALSGGLDSSSIFCAALKLRQSDATVCPEVFGIHVDYQGPLADENIFVEAIERQYGLSVRRIRPDSSRLISGCASDGLRTMEMPFLRGIADFTYPFEERVRGLGSRTVLSGHWADQILGDRAYLTDLFRQGRWTTVVQHLRTVSGYFPTSSRASFVAAFVHDLVARAAGPWMPQLREIKRRVSRDRFWFTSDLWRRARQVERRQAFRPPGRAAHQRSVYKSVRAMYYVQAMERCDRIGGLWQLDYAYPFLDRDLITFVMSVPGEVVCQDGVPKALLRRAMGDTLPSSITNRTWKAETTTAFSRAVESTWHHYSSCLEDDPLCVSFGYISKSSLSSMITALLRRVHDETAMSAVHLTDVIALELWLRTFFETSPSVINSPQECYSNVAHSK